MKMKRIFMLALAACLITLTVAGASLAYFTDTDDKTNVFTAGNVGITLTQDETPTRLYPGQTYNKKATITNDGTEIAYVGAIIDVTVADGQTLSFDAISSVLTGLNANVVKYATTDNDYKIYVVVEAELAVNGTVDVFSAMTIPAAWGNENLKAFNDLSIVVTAYATQKVGFADATEALTTAFDTAWAGYQTATNA